MDGFTYFNIFETKGIEYIIIIGFLLLIIPFWMLLNKPLVAYYRALKKLEFLSSKVLKIPQGIFYSKNHTWAYMEPEGIAKVGLNDLLIHITGPVVLSGLKNSGQKITKGSLIATIASDGKQLNITSPITGNIESVNAALLENPSQMIADPYGSGWIYKIKPHHWLDETQTFLFASDATNWLNNEFARFKDFVAIKMNLGSGGSATAVLQEGGELMDNPLSLMPVEVWQDFQTQFLDQSSI